MRLTGTTPPSIPTVGRPDGTTNCLSVKPINQPMSRLTTKMSIAIFADELVATFLLAATSQIQSIQPERAATLVLQQFEGDSFDALERRLRRNHSFREALDYVEPEVCPVGDIPLASLRRPPTRRTP